MRAPETGALAWPSKSSPVIRLPDEESLTAAFLPWMWTLASVPAKFEAKWGKGVFDGLVALAGPTGLLSEEYDPEQGRSLGNHPQAYSHLGLINNALTLAEP